MGGDVGGGGNRLHSFFSLSSLGTCLWLAKQEPDPYSYHSYSAVYWLQYGKNAAGQEASILKSEVCRLVSSGDIFWIDWIVHQVYILRLQMSPQSWIPVPPAQPPVRQQDLRTRALRVSRLFCQLGSCFVSAPGSCLFFPFQNERHKV